MPPPSEFRDDVEPDTRLSPRAKAAALALMLGPDMRAKVLAHLSEDELAGLAMEVADLGMVPGAVASEIAAEAVDRVGGGRLPVVAGPDRARQVLTDAFGTGRADDVMSAVSRRPEQATGFAALAGMDVRQSALLLAEEHPQTVAVTLAHLPSAVAAGVLESLPAEMTVDVAARVAALDKVDAAMTAAVANSFTARLGSAGGAAHVRAGGLSALVNVVKSADSMTERDLLAGLETRDPLMAAAVRDQLFLFEDVSSLDDRSLQLTLRTVAVRDVATALVGSSEALWGRVRSAMSQRAGQDLLEEFESLGPVRASHVAAARASVVASVRQLEADGVIVMPSGDDVYVT